MERNRRRPAALVRVPDRNQAITLGRSPAPRHNWDNAAAKRFNLLTGELDTEQSREGFGWLAARIGDKLGSERIGGTLYELADDQQSFPYHFHHGVEEWLYVIRGSPTLRTPDGERTLGPGDVLCFRSGADGAHSVRGPGRVLILSANRAPSIAVYPDSDKLGIRPGPSGDPDRLDFRRADAVGYWEGE